MNNWVSVDSNFPTFEEGESPYVQIQKLTDYMRQLTDQLKYSLNNLGTDNWNGSSLASFSTELTGDLQKDVQSLSDALKILQSTVSNISSKVTSLERQVGAIKGIENKITEMETAAQKQAQSVTDNFRQVNETIIKQQTTIQRIQKAVSMLCQWLLAGDEGLTIGVAGARVDLVGDVYINGVQEG